MTALENVIEAPIQVLGLSRIEAARTRRELLEMVGLADKINQPIRCSFPAASSSVWRLPGRWPCGRR